MGSGGESRRGTRTKAPPHGGAFCALSGKFRSKSTLDKTDKPPIIDISIIDMSIGGIKMQQTFHILLYRAFHAQSSVLRPCLTKLGLGTGQPKILGYLSRNGASGQRQLADYYDVDPAAVCRMLDSLEKGGFVTRHPDEADKRRDLIELTPAGQQAYTQWKENCLKMEERMLSGFTAEEQARFAEYLARAYQNLKGERRTSGEGL